MGRSPISNVTARITPTRSSPKTGRARRNSYARSIRRSCCITYRPNSPTAANLVLARRSASPPAGCTRADLSASSSLRVSSIACTAADKRGLERRRSGRGSSQSGIGGCVLGGGKLRTAMNCESPLPPQAAPTVPLKPRTGSPVATGTGRIVLPPHGPGMRIGLFGGTFDPVHAAHRAACLLAMKRLGLDRVWWLVTPGNPLKDTRGLAPLAERVHAAQVLAHHPR